MNKKITIAIVGCVLLTILVLSPNKDFSPHTLVSIPEGSSFVEASEILKEQKIITSKNVLHLWALFFGGARKIQAGDYLFGKPQGMFSVAYRLTQGKHGLETTKVFLPEGFTVEQMAERLESQLPNVSADTFNRIARSKEGYLFPDTYFFVVNATPELVVETLEDEFDEVIGEFEGEIASSTYSLEDIITMASIIEKEAPQSLEDKRIIAGILWKRLEIGMALQVDATLYYIFGRASHELTNEDLESDSPYNTYEYPGLPPGPISNPGKDSIYAALNPIKTEYFFYLSDWDGVMHYAKDFEEHKQNKILYL